MSSQLVAYKYCIIRCRPSLARGECVNVGLVLEVAGEGDGALRRCYARVDLDAAYRIARLGTSLARAVAVSELPVLESRLDEVRANGVDSLQELLGGVDGVFPVSQVMSGCHADPETRFVQLFEELVNIV